MTWYAAMWEAFRLAHKCPTGRFRVSGYVERGQWRYEVRCAGRVTK
jgi:hypothetical protein